ncbi:MAG: carboxypeptidase regulatory-like domain-containing protein [Acidobacteria bacterium]|nr:carboxypeptidase regulatory-like domain-containing protein [Acidobacteriota bacterium]
MMPGVTRSISPYTVKRTKQHRGNRHWLVAGTFFIAVCFATLQALGSDISGSVINKTKDKPASGDDVVLLSLSSGMQETARTKTDASGRFQLAVPDEDVQHLIRVVHQGVNYHKPIPQGTNSVVVEVYDVARQVEKIFGEGRVLRFQTVNGQLQVSEMYILRNESIPPRTRMSDRTFEVTLPGGAEVESGMAAGPGGMPVTSAPVPTDLKDHYAFVFPIRPGRTQFQITYHLPYSGNRAFDLNFDIPFAELGVMLPKSMQFKATGDAFQPAPEESGMSTYVVKSISPGQHVAFIVSGDGMAPVDGQKSNRLRPDRAPGGGLGGRVEGDAPIGFSMTGYVLGGLIIALTSGAYFVARRPALVRSKAPEHSSSPSATASEARDQTVSRLATVLPQAPAARSILVLDLLKEELFQIETERVQGTLSDQDYNQLRTGLNALMRRHMA